MAENANSIIQSSFRPHHDVVSGALGTQPARSSNGDLFMDASVSELNDEDKPSTESAINSDTRAPSGAVLNVSRYKLMSPAKLPISRSSCITIPPGLSPSSLLDSPILISDVKVEPSPTTGSLVKFQRMQEHEGSATLMAAVDSSDDRNIGNSESRHHDRTIFRSGLSSLNPLASAGSHFQQYESFVEVRDWEKPKSFTSLPLIRNEPAAAASSRDLGLSVAAPSTAVDLFNSSTSLSVDIDSSKLHQSKGSDMEVQVSELEDKEANLSVTGEKSTEDGYNWRKYGQKHVKGSEFPRSYYKCTYPNCQVKKLLERSQDGKITEIIYKGRHDHPKPQPKRRFAVGNVLSVNDENLENFSSLNRSEDKTSNAHGQTSYRFEPDNIPELRPSTTSDDEHDDDDNNDDNDPELKRRKQEFGNVDLSPLITPSREPRVVVQTISEVDILDDGYRWRKYGQKVVKGNPNPRSYYKCTNVGCPVRKHVERASHDPRAVITTYEGKHNHDVPAARSSNHETAAPSTYMTSMEAIRLTRLEGSDGISLDLGVGVSSSPEDASYEKQQTTEAGQERSRTQIASSDCDMTNEGTPRNFTNHQYEIRGQQGERFSFQTPPLNFSSNPYPQGMGNILMGP